MLGESYVGGGVQHPLIASIYWSFRLRHMNGFVSSKWNTTENGDCGGNQGVCIVTSADFQVRKAIGDLVILFYLLQLHVDNI